MSIQEVIIHPVFRTAFTSSEHPEGQYTYLGDRLGRDCLVERFVDGWMRLYDGDGKRNEDWYSFGADVLAPFDGEVVEVYVNPITNTPGTMNPGRAGSVVFRRTDDVKVVYCHVTDISVSVGETVRAGDVVAKVGNNGYSRCPHVHVGAWKGADPLQIRFDLQIMGRFYQEIGDRGYFLNDEQTESI